METRTRPLHGLADETDQDETTAVQYRCHPVALTRTTAPRTGVCLFHRAACMRHSTVYSRTGRVAWNDTVGALPPV